MSLLSGLDYNVILEPGESIKIIQGVPDNYAFSYINFANTQIIKMEKDLTNSKYAGNEGNNFLQLRYLMNGKRNCIIMKKIGEQYGDMDSSHGTISIDYPVPGGTTSGLRKNSLSIIGTGKKQQYKQFPTGIQTTVGSIIPQPLVPSDDFVGYDNGLFIDDKIIQSSFTEYGYNWSAYKMPVVSNAVSGVAEAVEKVSLYGVHQNQGYITNQPSRTAVIDFPIVADRRYVCDVNDTYCGKGSCAICYKFCTYNLLGQGFTLDQKNKVPYIQFVLDNPTSHFDDKNQIQVSGGLLVQIPPDDQILVLVKNYHNQGAISNSGSTNLIPPQAKGAGNALINMPLFIYPLYTGLVVTNSIIKNGTQNNDEIFVNFPAKTDPRYDVYFEGVTLNGEISTYMEEDSGGNMKWFPTLFQQATSAEREGIKILVNSDEKVNFGDEVSVYFSKATGNFAYCPLYFHRCLQFDLLFKGQFIDLSNNNDSGGDLLEERKNKFKYYLYPIYYYCGEDESPYQKITNCVVVSPEVQGVSGYVCIDSYLQQTIYRANLKFQSYSLARYPIQVFGVVLVLHREESPIDVVNDNGTFKMMKGDVPLGVDYRYNGNGNDITSTITTVKSFYELITNCQIQCGLQGVNGNLQLDGYAANVEMNNLFLMDQSIGEIDLDVKLISTNPGEEDKSTFQTLHGNPNPALFKGYGMEISVNNQQNNYGININLAGIQRKIQDMKLVCAPFWDGDRLEAICAYFQDYLKVNLRMVNYQCENISQAKPITRASVTSPTGTWKSCKTTAIGNSANVASPDFRVPRSWNWESPAVNFQTGKSCKQALDDLAKFTSCVFVVGLDGNGYFYELNDYGYPYYVDEQKKGGVVAFDLSDISTISLSPSIVNKYNSIATMGFIVRKKGGVVDQDSIATSTEPGIRYTNILKSSKYAGKTLFPWARHNINVEQGYLTQVQLFNLHRNRITFSIADVYQGTVTVRGNTLVNHVYQVIQINDIYFHVHSIDHNIDLEKKSWTTTYGITYQNIKDMD